MSAAAESAARAKNTVSKYLHRLTNVDVARQLFSDLNYDVPIPAPLSRAAWPAAARDALADDPKVIARHGEFRIIYSRLGADRLSRASERAIVNQLLHTNQYALFLFSDLDASDWHFVNVKYDQTASGRQVLRRFTVGPDERASDRLHTVSDQLGEVSLDGLDARELARLADAPLALQERYDKAFDVEAVTKRFFSEYHAVFKQVEMSITGFGPDIDRRRLFTQRLFNRLMFIAFIQKKGWLKFPDQAGNDYLSALWGAYRATRNHDTAASFYSDRLTLLFFNGLDNPHGTDDSVSRHGSIIESLIGQVPYLNGGLFE